MFCINDALAFESLIIIPKEKFPLAIFILATLYSEIAIKRSNHAQQNYLSSSLLLNIECDLQWNDKSTQESQ